MENIKICLIIILAISHIYSIVYVIKKRGFVTGMIWLVLPFRILFTWDSDYGYEEVPVVIDYIQFLAFGLLMLMWMVGR